MVIPSFESGFEQAFPALCGLFRSAPLTVHEGIMAVTLHGSRGPAGGAQENDDLDIGLLVDRYLYPEAENDDELVKEMLFTTLAYWRQKPDLDAKVIFDIRGCGLTCFRNMYAPSQCSGGIGCFKVYGMLEGKARFALNGDFNIKQIYPCITVWKRQ